VSVSRPKCISKELRINKLQTADRKTVLLSTYSTYTTASHHSWSLPVSRRQPLHKLEN